MGIGSYLRFFIGIVLAAETLRLWFAGESISLFMLGLAVSYILLSALWFVFKF